MRHLRIASTLFCCLSWASPLPSQALIPRKTFLAGFIATAMVLTFVVLSWLGLYTYDSYNARRLMQKRDLRIQELQGSAIHLDEALAMTLHKLARLCNVNR